MEAPELLREQIRQAHAFLEATIDGVTPDMAHWLPPGTANPTGATYAHIIISEDMIINGMLKQEAPLFAGAWAGRTGLDLPMPAPGPEWVNYGAWARSVKIDIAALREYAQAVYASTDAYMASLTAADLNRELDLSMLGMGRVNLAWVLSRLVLGHIDNICGEISCLKGLQGARGYPV